jgi:UDP-2-acetamido-2-deoxy-ribo-hexuluronate aminotransferase
MNSLHNIQSQPSAKIEMVNLTDQYQKIKSKIDSAINQVISSGAFINGPQVKEFETDLAAYLKCQNVIGCANGTDALQIALMALELKRGDEVIVPCFTYVATAEVIALLGLKPVLIEVDPETFNCVSELIEKAITSRTKAIVPVHLYGQCADMEAILSIACKYKLYVVEDAAQSLGADYTFKDGSVKKSGTMGDIGCTSFFPSKNLGCYGDGGAIMTNDNSLAKKIRMIANHGQEVKYYHKVVGVNSRLDTLQAAILLTKLPYLDQYATARQAAANHYDKEIAALEWIQVPHRSAFSTHVFHQYTVKLAHSLDRTRFKTYLQDNGIPSMIYYPLPLHLQQAFNDGSYSEGDFPISESLCKSVLSLPIHTEMTQKELNFITTVIKAYKNV